MADKQEIPSVKLHGVVDKILPPLLDNESEKAQIVIHEAETCTKKFVSTTHSKTAVKR